MVTRDSGEHRVVDRLPMNVRPSTRTALRDLLMRRPDLAGVGYSDFIDAAMRAYERGEWTVG